MSLLLLDKISVFILVFIDLSSHKVEERHMKAEERLVSLLKLDCVLPLDLVVSSHEEGLEGLASKLVLLLLLELWFDHILLGLGLLRRIHVLDVLCLNCKQARIGLVPEALHRHSVLSHFHLHEVVHIDIVDVEFGVRDAN